MCVGVQDKTIIDSTVCIMIRINNLKSKQASKQRARSSSSNKTLGGSVGELSLSAVSQETVMQEYRPLFHSDPSNNTKV